jgi:hypothetical protein
MKRAAALVAFAVVGACHFESSFDLAGDDPGRPGTAFQDVCGASAQAECEWAARCDGDSFARSWPDPPTCVARETLACQLVATDPNARYGDAEIRACTRPPDFPCPSDEAYAEANAAWRTHCQRPRGTLPRGATCSTSAACADGFCFMQPSEPLCGTCSALPCDGGCADGGTCFPSLDGSSQCHAQAAVGSTCSADADCESWLCRTGTCAARAGLGEPCNAPDSAPCDFRYECHPTLEKCVTPKIVKAGEPCGYSPTDVLHCGGGSVCYGIPDPTCIPPLPDGAPCEMQGLDCLFPAMCIAGNCRFRPLSCPSGDPAQ